MKMKSLQKKKPNVEDDRDSSTWEIFSSRLLLEIFTYEKLAPLGTLRHSWHGAIE